MKSTPLNILNSQNKMSDEELAVRLNKQTFNNTFASQMNTIVKMREVNIDVTI